MQPNMKRMQKEFAELVSIDSISFQERMMADSLKMKLKEIGFDVMEDDAGTHYASDTGNVYAYIKGTIPGEPLLFCAHMDTVTPGLSKKAFFHADGTVTSDGKTVLGADDLAGVVQILEGIRIVKEADFPHRDIEILFPIAEELYDKGTDVFDFTRIKSKEVYVLDMSGKVGSAALQAPTLISFEVRVDGKASHAGFAPEKGVNAIALAAGVITKVKQGRLDEETTLNIGTIQGGSATNIVSETCICTGEVRSFSHEKAIRAIEELENTFQKELEMSGATFQFSKKIELTAYKTRMDADAVKHFTQASKKLGFSGELVKTFGGSDNNNFAKYGIEGIVLSCGMYNAHAVNEYTTIEDLENGARLVAELIRIV